MRQAREKEAREQAVRETLALALDLFNSGHLVVSIDKNRVTKLNGDGSVSCPFCGKGVAAGNVLAMVDLWKGNANNPLSLISTVLGGMYNQAFPLSYSPVTCDSCKEVLEMVVQLVY